MASAPSRIAFLVTLLAAAPSSLSNAQFYSRALYPPGGSAAAHGLARLPGDGIVLVGEAKLPGGTTDFLVMRLHPSGNPRWTRTLATPKLDIARSVAVTSDGGIVVLGETGFEPGDPSSNRDLWVAKFNLDGALLWERRLGGPAEEIPGGISATADGGAVLVAGTRSMGVEGLDGWIVRLGAGGQIDWQQTIGGNGDDVFRSVEALADGTILAAGTTDSEAIFRTDVWVVQLTSYGALLWERVVHVWGYDDGRAVARLAIGEILVAGSSMEVSQVPTVALLVRLNGSGGYVGTRRYDAQGSGGWLNPGDRISAIAETPDQGVYLAGYRGDYPTGDLWLLRLDAAGSVLWQRLYGRAGDDEAAAAVALPDGGVVVAGRTTSFNLAAGAAWVFRLDAAGGVFPFCPPAGQTTYDEGFDPPDIGVPGLLRIEQSLVAGSVSHQLASPTFVSTAQCLGRPTEVSPPHSLRPLRFLDRERMEWEGAEANNASVFHLYRGDLEAPSDLGCFAPSLPTPAGADPGTPVVGKGWSYLVTGDGAQGEGTMGHDSGGAERSNTAPCP